MAEQQPASPSGPEGQPPSDQPVFHIEKLYLKDLSFESPNAPDMFLNRGQPRIDFNLDSNIERKGNEHYEVALHVTIQVVLEQKTMFLVEITYAGLFLLRHIPPEHVPVLLHVECPNVLFPYLRQIVSQVVSDGGFKPMVLEPINFAAVYQQSLQRQQAQGSGPTLASGSGGPSTVQ
jgi:preprotein translocase subunit SecB